MDRRIDAILACLVGIVFALLCTPLGTSEAGQRITYLGRALSWNGSSPERMPLSFTLHRAGSDDVPGEADDHALRRAFRSWERIAGASVTFRERGGAERDRVDWYEDDLHAVYFDEWNTTGFFPGRSGIVAVTPVQFLLTADPTTGELPILDADILFNGEDHRFSTDLTPGTFDIEGVAAHEIGHFLGLDHSAVGGATMFPYVAPAHSEQRALEPDDAWTARAAYPGPGRPASGRLAGRTLRVTGEPISGAHVVALDGDGVVAAGTLSRGSGRFELELPTGVYTLYAEPLDRPVTGGNVSSTLSVQTDFATTFLGGVGRPVALPVGVGTTNDVGDFVLGFPHAGNLQRSLVGTPLVVARGARGVSMQIEGDGLGNAFELRVTGSGVTYDGPTQVQGNVLSRTLSIDPQAVTGLRSVVAVDPWNRCTAYTGLLEIREPDPWLRAVLPAHGPRTGGQLVQIEGARLSAGSRILWNEVEVETHHVGDERLEIVTPPGEVGPVDVVVLRADGREARLRSAYHYAMAPAIDTVFPTAVQAAGGTLVTVTGGPFPPGSTATIGGHAVTELRILDGNTLAFRVPELALGRHDLELEVPQAGRVRRAAAVEALASPDPLVTSASRSAVSASGGESVQFVGAHFDLGTTVVFGADRATGRGGVPAAAVTWIAADVLLVDTPPSPSGPRSVLVRTRRGQVAWANEDLVFGAPLEVGQRFHGELSSEDEDVIAVALCEGASVRVRVQAPGRSRLLPELTLLDSQGRVVATTNRGHATYDPANTRGAGSRRVELVMTDVPATDVYAIHLRGEEASAGTYVLRVEVVGRSGIRRIEYTRRTPLAIGAEPTWLQWTAVAGTKLSWTWRSRDGEPLELDAFVGPHGSLLDDPRLNARVHTSADRTRLTLRVHVLDALGSYALALRTASGAPDAVVGNLSWKSPRARGRTAEWRP